MIINQKFINETVRRSVLIAYNEETRQLDFRAVSPVDKVTAIRIMEEACPEYNEFTPSMLESLPDDCKIILARELSVCMYVTGKVKNVCGADYCDYIEHKYPFDNVTRMWWD